MDYSKLSATDLAADLSFIEWVQRPDAANTAFWKTFLTQHPDRADVVISARQLVTGWRVNSLPPPAKAMGDVWKDIQEDLKTTDQSIIRIGQRLSYQRQVARYAAIFLALLVMAATFIWFLNHSESPPTYYATRPGETKTITLPDQSELVLAANSSVTVLGDWAPPHPRELALRGKAYFFDNAPEKQSEIYGNNNG